MPKIDPSDSKYRAGGIIPDGGHVVFINAIAIGKSSQKGTPYVQLTFECHDPDSPSNGSTLKYQDYWITPKSDWRFVKVMNAARDGRCPPLDTDDLEDLNRELLDRCLYIEKHSWEDGEYGLKHGVKWCRSLDEDELTRLRAAYDGRLVPAMEGGSPSGSMADGEFTDDEIPF